MRKDTIVLMGYAIQTWLTNEQIAEAKPRDLMPFLIEKGYFKKDHRDGLPLRKILRILDEENMLYLLPQVQVDRKVKNRLWSFKAIAI